MLGTILGRFSIIYFRGLGLRIRVWVRAWVWVRVRIGGRFVLGDNASFRYSMGIVRGITSYYADIGRILLHPEKSHHQQRFIMTDTVHPDRTRTNIIDIDTRAS